MGEEQLHAFLTSVQQENGGQLHILILQHSPTNAQALVVASNEIGLEVNADKTKYMVTSRDQNAERTLSMKTDNSSFEMVRVQVFGNNFNKSKFYSGRN